MGSQHVTWLWNPEFGLFQQLANEVLSADKTPEAK